jgi:hypothetical protein
MPTVNLGHVGVVDPGGQARLLLDRRQEASVAGQLARATHRRERPVTRIEHPSVRFETAICPRNERKRMQRATAERPRLQDNREYRYPQPDSNR